MVGVDLGRRARLRFSHERPAGGFSAIAPAFLGELERVPWSCFCGDDSITLGMVPRSSNFGGFDCGYGGVATLELT